MGKETIVKRKAVEGTIQKRTAQHPATVPTDIYVSKKSNKSAIIKRITRLMLKENHKTVTLHGLGAMVLRAVSIALAIQQQLNNQIDLKPTTETITLIDDVIPEDVDKDLDTQERQNSVIHIKLIAKQGLAELQLRTGKLIDHPSRNRKSRRWN